MKIWYQSGGTFGKNPARKGYETTLMNYLNSVARPGTEVIVHGVEIASGHLDRHPTEEVLHSHQVVANLIRAQREGYDAFCVGNAFDPAFYALREVADIPVCTLAEASMHLACLLSPNFAILCHEDPLLRRVTLLVKRYGLQDRFIECGSCNLSLSELLKAFEKPEIFLTPAREVAREAKRKGVCMFIIGEGIINMILAKHSVQEFEGIPVLQGGGALIKMAEMFVDFKNLGIADRSRLGIYTPIPKDHLATLMKLYGVT